ncbi:somatostatin receptor type 5-like [Notolabrus celidotus]|uniref:somatostatin receptor type 5-like n=1 Tax=Notolabrus celidotus TaxID=1203425 RepID=UPI00148F6DC1|nr:somatostatin receptor type 5-like [Notolabrus celidotus]
MHSVLSLNSSAGPDLPPHHSSNLLFHLILACLSSRANTYHLVALCIAYSLHLPLLVFVLYLGLKHRRGQKSSHSDVFTYHSIAMQLTEFLGLVMLCCGRYTDNLLVMYSGMLIGMVTLPGKALFHLLTCVERYLAVVHPIAYLGLRQAGRARIAYISIACVWLLSLVCVPVTFHIEYLAINIVAFIYLGFYLIIISYCSVSVLCVLKRPGPGGVGGNRDQSKQRAFYTIVVIMGVLMLRFGGNLIYNVIYVLHGAGDQCVLLTFMFWLDMPSNLVLPLLFLHRAGKLKFRKSG